jgi:hypothetical protein
MVDLNAPVKHWACPSCASRATTQNAEPHTEFHNCPGTGNLSLPLVEVGGSDASPDARHVPQIGEGGIITSIATEHGDGRVDRTVIM